MEDLTMRLGRRQAHYVESLVLFLGSRALADWADDEYTKASSLRDSSKPREYPRAGFAVKRSSRSRGPSPDATRRRRR